MERLRKYLQLEWLQAPLNRDDNRFRIAVLDSGISMHPDLREQIVGYYDFTGDGKGILDVYGHGTHIAGIISGKGYMSENRILGIDPGTELISLRILDEFGNGRIESMRDAMKWICDNYKIQGIRIINLSVYLNTASDIRLQKEICDMLQKLAAEDVIIIAAAGNGEDAHIDGLAAMPEVITVGCYNEQCTKDGKGCCQDYSGIGFCKEAGCKPDLVAPGYDILSCDFDYAKTGSYYCKKNGTSMSTAVVAGAVSLLLRYYPMLSRKDICHLIRTACRDLHCDARIQGNGMLDVSAILKGAEKLYKAGSG